MLKGIAIRKRLRTAALRLYLCVKARLVQILMQAKKWANKRQTHSNRLRVTRYVDISIMQAQQTIEGFRGVACMFISTAPCQLPQVFRASEIAICLKFTAD